MIVVLSGAGISAESGISTFRDTGGLWDQYDIMEVASPDGWRQNPELVLEFYNVRRRKIREALPNHAHTYFGQLESRVKTKIITQNIDDLHERGGSVDVLHLHGEILKARSTYDPSHILDCPADIRIGDKCEYGSQLRPHIVWFGESVPLLSVAADIVKDCKALIIVGTSLSVYPAAGLVFEARQAEHIYYIDPHPDAISGMVSSERLHVIKSNAVDGVKELDLLLHQHGYIR
jgi:NAD-dependent deacetylase